MSRQLPKYIINLINENKLIQTKHFIQQQNARRLKNIDIRKALMKGQVIEQLYKYNVGEKFLVYSKIGNQEIHIVVIFTKNKLILKTIYIPNKNNFENDMKTRLGREL